ncbi:cytochrome P450 [Streptomyces cirratus]|uniref:cytochrome P450 n=1 Tax=Streptomyces cirratus TaxID=68187 RepID=UPI001E3335F4|nr:cytochrome P450 [Streptomyces cirratus]
MIDSTASLLARGYAWLPGLQERAGEGPVVTRLMGRRTVVLDGPGSVEFFYDEQHVRREGALPGPVLDTLIGRGAVHTLDGGGHRVRKDMFVSLLMAEGGIAALTERFVARWPRAVAGWQGREVVLFDEVAAVLAGAVCDWVGLPLSEGAARSVGEDCVAMVDGFATPGPRHWKARRARARQERALRRVVTELRTAAPAPSGGRPRSVLTAVAWHRDADGRLLDPRTAAVELLNIIRPTVALSWFAVFAAHALHSAPVHRDRLRGDDGTYARAFAHEVRRFYPFAPFIGGLAARDLRWRDVPVPEGSLVLLDLYGRNHDPEVWPKPCDFDPCRFMGREPPSNDLVPQGGGDVRTGHRCPGEDIAVGLLTAIVGALADLDCDVPEQDLTIPLHRMPTRPRSGFVLAHARTAVRADGVPSRALRPHG